MKKKVLLFAMLVVLLAAPCWAVEDYAQSSGLLSSSGVVGVSGGSYALVSLEAITDGTNDTTVIAYNGTTTGGQALVSFYCVASSRFCGATFPYPLIANNGLYISITGSGSPRAIATYMPR
jgi:hypothetical protein